MKFQCCGKNVMTRQDFTKDFFPHACVKIGNLKTFVPGVNLGFVGFIDSAGIAIIPQCSQAIAK